MEELLKKLLEAEVLTEETKQELQDAFVSLREEAITSAKEEARAEVTAEVTAELNEQWISEREVLIEALDARVTEMVTEELAELKRDIENFRDLEIEYAEKLVEAKAEMHKDYLADMDELVEKIDNFLEIKLTSEMEELREDISEVRKNQFGRQVFEAFVNEFKNYYAHDDASTQARLDETEQRLADAVEALEKSERTIARMEREKKLEETLKPLNGRTREVMEAILKNVDTSMIEEAYTTYISRVLRETTNEQVNDKEKTSEKEVKVLAEGVKDEKGHFKVLTGDRTDLARDEQIITENEKNVISQSISNDEKLRLRRMAGLA